MSLIILFLFVPVLIIILLGLNIFLAAHKPDAEKIAAYECGMPSLLGQTRAPFNVAYYLVALLFVVFDLEIAIFYPLATSLYQISYYGFWVGVLFILLLTVRFVYELGKGAIYFTNQRASLRPPSLKNSSI